MNRFEGKAITITGGGSGLGRACALQWSSEGASVVVSDLVESRAAAVAKEIEERGGKAIGLKADVRIESEVEIAVRETVEQFGKIDIMFANAGCIEPGGGSVALEDMTEEQWDYINNVLARGVFFSGKYACREMKKQGRGNIVVTTSAAGLISYPGFSGYGAAKSAAVGLVKAMAVDWGKYGIRVNGLAPTHGMSINFALPPDAPVLGMSYEEFALKDSGGEWKPEMFPGPLKAGRPPGLRDNAAVASFLASDDSEYMSGIVIPSCDGGNFALISIPFPEDFSIEDQVGPAKRFLGLD